MGCQSDVVLGDNLTFSITCHDPDTGILTDADSAPAYRVYEDETGTAILTGTMAVLDNANTTGFYTEQIACTAANGFEDTKSYTIYITATVDSDQGGISYGFRCYNAWTEGTRTLTQSAASVTAAVSGDMISIHRGDTFTASITGLGNISTRTKLWFSVKENKSDADTAAIIMIEETTGLIYLNGAAASVAGNGTITVNDAVTGSITVTLAAAETDDLIPQGGLYYDVQMLSASGVSTLSDGPCAVVADITRAVS